MVALSASRLVCDEISVMVSVTLPICCAAAPNWFICSLMRAAWRVASSVMRRAFSELPAISPMVAVICSVAEATLARLVVVCSIPAATDTTLAVICSAAAATACALPEASREPSDIWAELADNSADEEDST